MSHPTNPPPPSSRYCQHCPAYPFAIFRNGELAAVSIMHLCGQPAQPQKPRDWQPPLTRIEPRHANRVMNPEAYQPRKNSDRRAERPARHRR